MIHQGCLVSLFEHSLLRLRAISFMFPGNQGRSIEASLQNPMCEVDPPSAQEPRKKHLRVRKARFTLDILKNKTCPTVLSFCQPPEYRCCFQPHEMMVNSLYLIELCPWWVGELSKLMQYLNQWCSESHSHLSIYKSLYPLNDFDQATMHAKTLSDTKSQCIRC
jgi:hypothetical protein